MDPESVEVLYSLTQRWKQKVDEWAQQTEEARSGEKLEADIQMLCRHMEALSCVQKTLGELDAMKQQLTDMLHAATPEELLESVDRELQAMRCLDEDFILKYMHVMGDYRVPPEALPVPYGLKCHRLYRKEMENMRERMHKLQAQIAGHQQAIKSHMEEHGSMTTKEVGMLAQINIGLNMHQNLQVGLYRLVSNVQPINAAQFHAKCRVLLEKRLRLLERKRLAQMEHL